MKNYSILILAVFLVSCQQKRGNPLESINVLYLNSTFYDRIISVGCNEIVYRPIAPKDTCIEYLEDGSGIPKAAVILDTTIRNKIILKKISDELKFAEKTTNNNIDARMKCYLNYMDGSIDSICIDDTPNYTIYNNILVKLTNKLIYLIRKNCGFYEWVGIGRMEYLIELNDNTFV